MSSDYFLVYNTDLFYYYHYYFKNCVKFYLQDRLFDRQLVSNAFLAGSGPAQVITGLWLARPPGSSLFDTGLGYDWSMS